MVFCNMKINISEQVADTSHNPYFNRWFSAIDYIENNTEIVQKVTILILIDGFLQSQFF